VTSKTGFGSAGAVRLMALLVCLLVRKPAASGIGGLHSRLFSRPFFRPFPFFDPVVFGMAGCRLGGLRYSRLGSLRYIGRRDFRFSIAGNFRFAALGANVAPRRVHFASLIRGLKAPATGRAALRAEAASRHAGYFSNRRRTPTFFVTGLCRGKAAHWSEEDSEEEGDSRIPSQSTMHRSSR
jgi:hypothetical protein